MFRTSGKPYSLCCLHNGDIVVTFRESSKVTVYNEDGQIKQTLDHINTKFKYPLKVSVNKVNQDIYICNHVKKHSSSAGKLLAVGVDYQLRYEYTGQGDSEFTPVGVCTDEIGHILITDCKNDRVHILDKEGQFIQYILTSQQGLSNPKAIDVDTEGYLWVGESINIGKGCFKMSRYLC